MNGYNGYYVDEQTLREVIETVGQLPLPVYPHS